MRNIIAAGAVAGLIAGVAFGVMMQMMSVPTPDGMQMPMMAMVAQVVGSSSVAVGWLYHLFNSAVIGAVFGWLLADRAGDSTGRAVMLGAGYGLIWWVLGALVLMPLVLGMPAFAPLRMPGMLPVAMGSLMGHLLYGVVLGASLVWLRRRAPVAVLQTQRRG